MGRVDSSSHHRQYLLQGLDPPMLDAPWPSGFGPPEQRQAPPITPWRDAKVDMADIVAVEADILPGGTVRLGNQRTMAHSICSWQVTLSAMPCSLHPCVAGRQQEGRAQCSGGCVWALAGCSRRMAPPACESLDDTLLHCLLMVVASAIHNAGRHDRLWPAPWSHPVNAWAHVLSSSMCASLSCS